jgi:phosphatidylglycerophosphate synthase
MVTVVNLLVVTILPFLIVIEPFSLGILLFFLTFQLWKVLDNVDGEMARYLNRRTLSGPYLDQISHLTAFPALFVSLAIVLARELNEPNLLLIGFMVAILALLSVGIYHLIFAVLLHSRVFDEEAAQDSEELPGGALVTIYRFLTWPMEMSLVVTLLLLATLNGTFAENIVNYWYLYFGFYLLIFGFSILRNIVSSKRKLDIIQRRTGAIKSEQE